MTAGRMIDFRSSFGIKPYCSFHHLSSGAKEANIFQSVCRIRFSLISMMWRALYWVAALAMGRASVWTARSDRCDWSTHSINRASGDFTSASAATDMQSNRREQLITSSCKWRDLSSPAQSEHAISLWGDGSMSPVSLILEICLLCYIMHYQNYLCACIHACMPGHSDPHFTLSFRVSSSIIACM